MTDSPSTPGKDLLLSRSFWGAVMMLVGLLLKLRGHEVDPEKLTDQVMAVVEAILPFAGFVLSFVGTVFCKGPITGVAGFKLFKG